MNKRILVLLCVALLVLVGAACKATPTPTVPEDVAASVSDAVDAITDNLPEGAAASLSDAMDAAVEGLPADVAASVSDAVDAVADQLTMTTEELAAYNGKDGQPAYIAVSGVIYDVTNVPEWTNGEHNGFEAGTDQTDAILKQSPHGISKLEGVPVVGMLK